MSLEIQPPAPIRFGVIGPGQIAGERLVPALKAVPGATFWSVLGRDASRTGEFAAKHEASAPNAVHTALDVFLSDPALDAVIIATPDRQHASQAIAAAKAGKHVFVEKPMATSAEESRQILAAVQAAKVKLAAGYHLRFHAGHRAAKELLLSGKIGKPRHMRVCWTMKADSSDWRAASQTGRWWSLGATGTHALDLVRWFLSPQCGEIVDVKSVIDTSQFGGSHDETAAVSLRLASGATAQVVSSVVFRAPRVVEIFGENGSIVCNGTLGPRGSGEILVNDEKLEYTAVDPYRSELENFVSSIRDGTAPESDGVEGAANVALLELATNGHERTQDA